MRQPLKMPEAHLYQADFSKGLAEPLQRQSYDFITATYSLHHLKDDQKVEFLRSLCKHLNPNGKIMIGDVAFETRTQLEECQQEFGDEWDDEEIYFVAEELRNVFPGLTFTPVSYCAGILTISL